MGLAKKMRGRFGFGANLANTANINGKTDCYRGSLTTYGDTADPDNPNSLEEARDVQWHHFHMSPLLVMDDVCIASPTVLHLLGTLQQQKNENSIASKDKVV